MVTKATRDVIDLASRSVNDIDLNGGTIDGTIIGSENPSEGYFTNLETSNLTVTNNLDISGASITGPIYANYADIAEYYVADQDYEYGTVVKIGGEKEITVTSRFDLNVYGVITHEPAFVLNTELAHHNHDEHVIAVALIGKTPVKVYGRVKKGDWLISVGEGVAVAYNDTMYEEISRLKLVNPFLSPFFAISLEDKDTDTLGHVMAVMKKG